MDGSRSKSTGGGEICDGGVARDLSRLSVSTGHVENRGDVPSNTVFTPAPQVNLPPPPSYSAKAKRGKEGGGYEISRDPEPTKNGDRGGRSRPRKPNKRKGKIPLKVPSKLDRKEGTSGRTKAYSSASDAGEVPPKEARCKPEKVRIAILPSSRRPLPFHCLSNLPSSLPLLTVRTYTMPTLPACTQGPLPLKVPTKCSKPVFDSGAENGVVGGGLETNKGPDPRPHQVRVCEERERRGGRWGGHKERKMRKESSPLEASRYYY